MYVIKRDFRRELIDKSKITERLRNLCEKPGLARLTGVNLDFITQKVAKSLCDSIHTSKLDALSAEIADCHKINHSDYSVLASRILISDMHKRTEPSFSKTVATIQADLGLIQPDRLYFIMEHAAEWDVLIDHSYDYGYSHSGIKILIEADYLIKNHATGKLYERPQHLLLRCAIAMCWSEASDMRLARVKEVYLAMRDMKFTHATPTLHNACLNREQLFSCFLGGVGDSTEHIMLTLTRCAHISRSGGGIGIHMHDIRSAGSIIKSTNSISQGLPNQLMLHDRNISCWHQNLNRPGSQAVYLEPWQADIEHVLHLSTSKTSNDQTLLLFYAIWAPELFLRRAIQKKPWTLFSSDTAPGLSDIYDGIEVCTKCGYNVSMKCDPCTSELRQPPYLGAAPRVNLEAVAKCEHEMKERDLFTEIYESYERAGLGRKTVNARDLMDLIVETQRERGRPYMCNKDAVNRRTNCKYMGVIKSSNLCTEIMQISTSDSYASCTLASVSLPAHVVRSDDGSLIFDHMELYKTTRMVVRNLDNAITINKYPIPECEDNGRKLRAIGVGIQGLANLLMTLNLPYDSDEAALLDLSIAETMYFAAMAENLHLGLERGPHYGYEDAPAGKGIFQFDLWEKDRIRDGMPTTYEGHSIFSGRWDWADLKQRVRAAGGKLRHCLLIAHMPTASTSVIMGNVESFEPIPANIYNVTSGIGTYSVVNPLLVKRLEPLGLWSDNVKRQIMENNGSVRTIEEIPQEMRDVFKITIDIKHAHIMKRAAFRCAFVDQAASLNAFLTTNSSQAMRGVMQLGLMEGLKTISYYVRTSQVHGAKKMANVLSCLGEIDTYEKTGIITEAAEETVSDVEAPEESLDMGFCTREEGCVACSS